MNVKSFLDHVRESFLQVQVLCARAEKYREMATSAGSGNRKAKSPEPYVIELMDIHAELQEKVSGLLADSRLAEKLIDTLENKRQCAVLQLHYLCGHTFQEIANEVNYTSRWVYKLHNDGIAELERRYANENQGNTLLDVR